MFKWLFKENPDTIPSAIADGKKINVYYNSDDLNESTTVFEYDSSIHKTPYTKWIKSPQHKFNNMGTFFNTLPKNIKVNNVDIIIRDEGYSEACIKLFCKFEKYTIHVASYFYDEILGNIVVYNMDVWKYLFDILYFTRIDYINNQIEHNNKTQFNILYNMGVL